MHASYQETIFQHNPPLNLQQPALADFMIPNVLWLFNTDVPVSKNIRLVERLIHHYVQWQAISVFCPNKSSKSNGENLQDKKCENRERGCWLLMTTQLIYDTMRYQQCWRGECHGVMP